MRRVDGGRGGWRVSRLGASCKGPATDACRSQTPALGKGGRQVSWSGAFADGSWEGEASGSDGDDESGGKPPRRPLSAQLMMKVANLDKDLETIEELGWGGSRRAKEGSRGGLRSPRTPSGRGLTESEAILPAFGQFKALERIPTSPTPARLSSRPSTAPVRSKKLTEKWGHLAGPPATHESVTEDMCYTLDRLHTLKGKRSGRAKYSEVQMRRQLFHGLPRKLHEPHFEGSDHGVTHLKVLAEKELLSKKIPALMCVMERRIIGNCMNLANSNFSARLLETMKSSLAKHPEVSELRLLDNNLAQDFCQGLVEVLQETQNITSLDLSRNKLRGPDVKTLCKIVGHGKIVAPLKKERAQESYLDESPVLSEEEEEAALQAEVEARRLAEINAALSEFRFQDLRSHKVRNFFLNVLNLSHNPIGCAGAQQLAKALRRNKIVIDLDVSGCSIGRNGCRALTSALAENDTLKSLKLSWNNFGDSMSANCLAGMIAGNQTLTRLRLVMVGLGDAHGTAIAKAMEEDAGLKELYLSENKLGPRFCHALGKSMRKNLHSVLEKLDISMNPLSFHGAQDVTSAFQEVLSGKDHKLRYINIQGCSFHHEFTSEAGYKQTCSTKGEVEEGWYRLDLSVPAQREVATTLANVWNESGARTWECSSFNGRPFNLSEGLNWPKRMPKKGELILDFRPPKDFPMDSSLEPMPSDVFNYLWHQAELSNDNWKISVTKVLCHDFWFTSSQASKIISSFTISQLRFLAGQCVLSRIVDCGEMHDLKVAFLDNEWERLMRFHGCNQEYVKNNPTGHYRLNLGLGLGLFQLNSFKKHSARQIKFKVWPGDPLYYNTCRNVKVNGKEVPRDTDFQTFEFPPSAIVELDYVSHFEPIGEHIPAIVLKLACKLLREDFETFNIFKKKILRELRFFRKITALDALHTNPDAHVSNPTVQKQQEPAAAEIRQFLQNLTINQTGHLLSSIRWLASLFVFKSDEAARILKNSARSVDDFVTIGTYMFSRISDKHQFKTVLKEMPHEACHRILTHIGFLRIIHAPTAYGLYFKLRLGVPEEREYCNIIIKHVVRYRGTTELAGLRLNGNLVQNVKYDSNLWRLISGQLYDSAASEEGGAEAGRSRSNSDTSNVVEFLLQGPDADGKAIQSAIRIQAQWRKWAQRKIFFRQKIASLTIKIHLFRKLVVAGEQHREHLEKMRLEEEDRKKMRRMWSQRMRCNLSLAVHRQETIIRSYYKTSKSKVTAVIRGNLTSMENMTRGTGAGKWSHGVIETGPTQKARRDSSASQLKSTQALS